MSRQNVEAFARKMWDIDKFGLSKDGGGEDLTSFALQAVPFTATLAEINAGKTIVPAVVGRTYQVHGVKFICTGSFAAGTDIRISDTAGTPVDVVTVPVASLTDGALITESTANNVVGTMFADLTASKGVQIRKTGSSMTTATKVTGVIFFRRSS